MNRAFWLSIIVCSVFLSTTVQAVPMLDQSNLAVPGHSMVSSRFDNLINLQTFSVGMEGELVGISIGVSKATDGLNDLVEPLTVMIWQWSDDVPFTHQPRVELEIPASLVLERVDGVATPQLYIDLSYLNHPIFAHVQPNWDQFGIGLSCYSPDTDEAYMWEGTPIGDDTYSGGQGGIWSPYSSSITPYNISYLANGSHPYDRAFQTFIEPPNAVSIPDASMMLLMGSSLMALVGLGRKEFK